MSSEKNNNFVFKSEVPIFYNIFNNIEMYKSLSRPIDQTTNIIKYTFARGVCQQHSLEVLDSEQVSTILKDNNVEFSTNHIENLKALEELFKRDDIASIYSEIQSANKYIQKEATKFFREIECFINVKFESFAEISSLSNKYYAISLCSMPDKLVMENFNNEALTQFCTFDDLKSFHAAQIVFDGLIRPHSIYPHTENTVRHEILHLMGLGHPSYSSIKDNKKYRSIVEDTADQTGLPLSKYCYKKYSSPKERLDCAAPPTKLTPVDVKGLISIWGESRNESEFCQNIRAEFTKTFSEYLQPTGEISAHEEL